MLTLSYLAARFMEAFHLLRQVQLAVLGVLLLVGLLLGELAFWIPAEEGLSQRLINLSLGIPVIAVYVVFAWYRGFTLAHDGVRPVVVWKRFRFDLVAMLFYLFFVDRLRTSLGLGYAMAFLFFGLFGMILTRIGFVNLVQGAQKNPFDRRWSISAAGTVGMVINVVNASVQQNAGSQMLALIRTLGNQPGLEMRAPDETYFPILGRLVHYPITWAFPLAIVAAIFFVGTLTYGFQQKALTWRGLGLRFLTSLLSLVCIMGVSILLWNGIQALHPEYGYAFNRVHVSDDILYVLGFFFLAFAFTTTSVGLVRKKTPILDLAAGSLSLWLLAPAVAILVPETSFLGTWVLFSGSSRTASFAPCAPALSGTQPRS